MENVENTNEATGTEQEAPRLAEEQPQENRNVLLGTISYTNIDDYETFLTKMDINQSLFVLIAAANYGQSKGLFNLDEGELVAKAIKTIKRQSTPAVPAGTEGPVVTAETTEPEANA